MANTPEAKKNSQPSSKPTLEQLVKNANDKKQISKEELAVILERYKTEQKNISDKIKAEIDSLSKEAGMDMLKKGITIKNDKDFNLFFDILTRNGVKVNISDDLKKKILSISSGVVATYTTENKMITLYSTGKGGNRIGYINEKGEHDQNQSILWFDTNDTKDDDLGLIKDKNAIKETVKKESIPSATEQEIKDAQFGLDVLDKYTKIDLNEICKKSGIDGIKKLAKLHGMMSQGDIRIGLQSFGHQYDFSHILAAVKILKVFGEDKTKIEAYLNGGEVTKDNNKNKIVAEGWLNPDDIEKHRKIFLETLKKSNDINQLLTKENRPSYDFLFKNLNHKNTAGKFTFEEEGKLFGEKLKSYTCEKYKLDQRQLNIFIDPKEKINIKIKLGGNDYGQIIIKENKFELNKIELKADNKKETKSENSTYTVKKGDSLWKITKGDNNLMKKIKELNPDVKDWNKLNIGQIIKMPSESNITGKGEAKAEKKKEKQPKKSNKKAEKTGEIHVDKKEVEKKDDTKQEAKGKKEEKGVKGQAADENKTEGGEKEKQELAELKPEWSAKMNGQKAGTDKNDVIKTQRLNNLIEEVIKKKIVTRDDLASIISQFNIEKQYIETNSVINFSDKLTKISSKMLENGINVDKKDLGTINTILNYLGIKGINEALFPGESRYYVVSSGTKQSELAVYSSGENGFRLYYIDTNKGKIDSNSENWFDKNIVTNDSRIMIGNILGDEYKVTYTK